jgi:integrase
LVKHHSGWTHPLKTVATFRNQLIHLNDRLQVRSGVLLFRKAVLYCPPTAWLLRPSARPYPISDALGVGFHPTFQVLRRSFSTHGQEEMRPKEMQVVLGHEDSRTTQEIYTQTVDAKVMQHVNDMANRLLGLEAPLASKERQ